MTTKIPIRTVYDAQNDPIGLAEFQDGEYVGVEHGGTGANTIASARENLGVDPSNIRGLITVTGAGSYDNTTGEIVITGGVTSVGGATGAISNVQLVSGIQEAGILTTANIAELDNLYFTNSRVYANVIELNYATVSYVNEQISNVIDAAPEVLNTLNEISAAIGDDPNFYTNITSYSSVTFNQANAAYDRANVAVTVADSSFNFANTLVATVAGVSSTSISNLQIFSGLLQTGSLTTANVTELTNLYFTNARARAAFTAGSGIEIQDGTISVANTLDYGLIDGAITTSNDYGSI